VSNMKVDRALSDPSGGALSLFHESHYDPPREPIEWVSDRTRSLYKSIRETTVSGVSTGCIVRIYHGNKVALAELADVFKEDGCEEVEVIASPGYDASFCLIHKRKGNLDLETWLQQIAGDLADIRLEGMMPNLGDTITISVELDH
jgi:hypothetical protein